MQLKKPMAAINENLALFYSLKGSYTQAEELYKHSLEMREEVQGTDHIDVAMTLEKFADNYTRNYYKGKLPEDVLITDDIFDIWMRDFTTVNPLHPSSHPIK